MNDKQINFHRTRKHQELRHDGKGLLFSAHHPSPHHRPCPLIAESDTCPTRSGEALRA
jgi:hypothetical protein